ncbi:MAG: O-antigen ligase family protein [Novosphingobium sp.]
MPALNTAPPPRPVNRRLTREEVKRLSMPLVLFWALLLPAGLSLDLGGVVIPPYRLVAMVLMPFAIMEIVQQRLRMTVPDWLIIGGAAYGFVAAFVALGIDRGLQFGGSFVIDSLGAYLVGRAYLVDARRLREFLRRALPGALIIAGILVFESISHQLLIAPLFPQRGTMENLYEIRMGLLRARATFPHSIAAGMFMMSLLSLYFLSGLPQQTRLLGVLASLAAIFTVSSTAFLALALTAFLLAYRGFFNVVLRMRERLIYLVYAFIALYVSLELFTGRGAIRTLIQYATLNPRSGYYRIQIWTYGSASVEHNPWFGIGDKAMARAHWMVMETIDNHWLMLAVRYGLPTALLFGLGVVWALWRCGARNRRLNALDYGTTIGAMIALAVSAMVAWAGALWANNIAWFMMTAGFVVALSEQVRLNTGVDKVTRRKQAPRLGMANPPRHA